jgi:uncharacterized protein (TIGR04255 family)
MIRHRYKKSAIQEAIFEIKFPYENFDVALPGQIFERVKQNYPKKKDISLITLAIGRPSNPPQAPIIQTWKDDDSALIQVGPGIATANQLKYSNWEGFTPGIQEILHAYIDLAKPNHISGLGVRYINRFIIEEKSIKLSDYFHLGFQLPEFFSDLQGFDLTLVHKKNGLSQFNSEFKIKTKFMTDSLRPEESGYSFILDIDCYIDSILEPKSDQVMQITKHAHDIIEEIFESIISDKIRGLMEIIP